MMRKIFAGFMCFVSITAFACRDALPTDDKNFCASFKSVATCYCTSSGFPAGMCQNMEMLYQQMIGIYHSLKKACDAQRYTDPQNCLDNWQCYRVGGVDSRGRLCNSTKEHC